MGVNYVKVTNNGRKNASLIKVHKWYWIVKNKWSQTTVYTILYFTPKGLKNHTPF